MRKFLPLLLATACSTTAYAAGPRTALAVAPERSRAPYDVQILTEAGEVAPTYAFKGRYYVQGNDGEHYAIRIANPTGNRVEAVVSVDGLDVVDGEGGDLRKRGYIVPAYGEVRIEGFRTSLADVASFRFSSVDDSYAGKKGKARNVGVIAVAIFEETAPAPDTQIIAPQVSNRYRWNDDVDAARSVPRGAGGRTQTAKADKAERKTAAKEAPAAAPTPAAPGAGDSAAHASVSKAPSATGGAARGALDEGEYMPPTTEQAPRTNRPGLGTEFGESRYSAASYTRFVRATNRPIAVAELRYNDVAGLVALGIPVQPMPDDGEIMTRETANPFPGDGHFAHPPR